MSEAKLKVMESLQEIPDSIEDELQIIDDLYKLVKLRRSQKSIIEQGTMTTAEVKDYFAKRREGNTAEC